MKRNFAQADIWGTYWIVCFLLRLILTILQNSAKHIDDRKNIHSENENSDPEARTQKNERERQRPSYNFIIHLINIKTFRNFHHFAITRSGSIYQLLPIMEASEFMALSVVQCSLDDGTYHGYMYQKSVLIIYFEVLEIVFIFHRQHWSVHGSTIQFNLIIYQLVNYFLLTYPNALKFTTCYNCFLIGPIQELIQGRLNTDIKKSI